MPRKANPCHSLFAQRSPVTAPYPSSACSAQSSKSPSFPFRPANASHSAQLSQPAALTEQKLPSIFHSQPQPHSRATATQQSQLHSAKTLCLAWCHHQHHTMMVQKEKLSNTPQHRHSTAQARRTAQAQHHSTTIAQLFHHHMVPTGKKCMSRKFSGLLEMYGTKNGSLYISNGKPKRLVKFSNLFFRHPQKDTK